MTKNKLAEWLFEIIINILNSQELKVKVAFMRLNRKKPEKIGKKYIGHLGWMTIITDDEDEYYFIKIEKRVSERTKMRVFLHEILHVIFDEFNVIGERLIKKGEFALWPLLSESQKQLLKEYMYTLAKE